MKTTKKTKNKIKSANPSKTKKSNRNKAVKNKSLVKKSANNNTKTEKNVKASKSEVTKKLVQENSKQNVVQNDNKVTTEKQQIVITDLLSLPLLLIIILVIILIWASTMNSDSTSNNCFFSSSTSRFKYGIYENEQNNNEKWSNINKNTTIELNMQNIKIDIYDTIENTIFSIDPDNSYFNYYGENYIALPTDNEYTIEYLYYNPNNNSKIQFEASNDCIEIENDIIRPKHDGSTEIYVVINDIKTEIIKMDICSNITNRPKEFDTTKPFLSCEQFTNIENELLDRILENKIKKVGYQTRAGAVEALRFLTLDFSYRIAYFSENGRLPYVDGEGRYYHKGLYLSDSKYNSLVNPNKNNKGTWGCTIHSFSANENETNGLDCSGLMCWALYNDGFDPDDKKGANLLMDLGEIVKTNEAVESGRVKVGDFVHNNEAGSHIGMIIGIDENEYYVAQAIWYDPFGVSIVKYPKEIFIKHWLQVILLDSYYKNDGQLTNMWY